MAIYNLKDTLGRSIEIPDRVVLDHAVVLASLMPDSFLPVLWFASSHDLTIFERAYMAFDIPGITHSLESGGGKIYTYYGQPGKLTEIHPDPILELRVSAKNRILHDLLTKDSYQQLYIALNAIASE